MISQKHEVARVAAQRRQPPPLERLDDDWFDLPSTTSLDDQFTDRVTTKAGAAVLSALRTA